MSVASITGASRTIGQAGGPALATSRDRPV
jgi:hypothetical protein